MAGPITLRQFFKQFEYLDSTRFTRRLFVQRNPLSRRGLDREPSWRFGLLCQHHQLVTWLNEQPLSAARSKRCSSITCMLNCFSRAINQEFGRGIRSMVFLKVERRRVPHGVIHETSRLESLLFSGYDPHLEGDEPPDL